MSTDESLQPTAAGSATAPGGATAPSSATSPDGARLADEARRILDEVQRLLRSDAVDDVPDQAAQDLLLAAVRLFSAKRDRGSSMAAFGSDQVTATDVAVTAVAMTQVVNLELFELALWHGWSNI
jgi:hypothetical protein